MWLVWMRRWIHLRQYYEKVQPWVTFIGDRANLELVVTIWVTYTYQYLNWICTKIYIYVCVSVCIEKCWVVAWYKWREEIDRARKERERESAIDVCCNIIKKWFIMTWIRCLKNIYLCCLSSLILKHLL